MKSRLISELSDKLNTPFWQGTKFAISLYFALPTTVRHAVRQHAMTTPREERMPGWTKADYAAESWGMLLGIPAMVAPICGIFTLARENLPFPFSFLGYADIATQLLSTTYEGGRLALNALKREAGTTTC